MRAVAYETLPQRLGNSLVCKDRYRNTVRTLYILTFVNAVLMMS